MKGCWKLDVPFVRSLDVGSPSLSRTDKNTPAKPKNQTSQATKQPRHASPQGEESTDAGSASTKSTKGGVKGHEAGWKGYAAHMWVECVSGYVPMRSAHEISQDMARKYPLSQRSQEQRAARDRRPELRGSTCEQSIDLTASPEAPISTEDLLFIQETAEEVTALAMESLVSPDTLTREVSGVTNAEYEQSRPIAGLSEEQERTSEANAAKGVMTVNSDAGAKRVAKTSVDESESGDEVLVVFVPAENQAFGPPLSPPVMENHKESLYLMSLGEETCVKRAQQG